MSNNTRYPLLDSLRGLAILAMMAYHFGFDLNMQGYIVQDLNNSITWQIARSLILGAFLLLAGFSMALAKHQAVKHRLMRLLRIAVCALLVSVVSYLMFAESWIFFGVLHFMVVASLICWCLMPYKKFLFPLAIFLLGIGLFYQLPIFDQPLLQWVGMVTHKPITEDYVPMAPWLGVMMTGVSVGQWASLRAHLWPLACTPTSALKPVQWLGRHSLAAYMLHQPILLGALGFYGVIYE